MTHHPNRSRAKSPASNPTPDEIFGMRINAGITQQHAADLVYSGLRTWQQWEAGDRRMHPGLWELFLIKTNPPVNPAVEAPAESKDPVKEYKIKLIENLIEHVRRMSEFSDKFDELFGVWIGSGDNSYSRFIDNLFNDQIRLVAELIGDSKDGLEWFVYENECGNKGHQAGIDGDMRHIRTVEDYLWLVDLEQNIESTPCSSSV